ncbi:MAG: hypothetical protein AAF560_12855 [Acidobacteriota bacterium]
MLRFSLTVSEAEEEVCGFSLGHMVVTGREGAATSVGHRPDQSMMIFLAAVELLDGLRRFLRDPAQASYHFVGVDSSFQWVAEKLRDSVLLVGIEGRVDEVPASELTAAALAGVRNLVAEHHHQLDENDAAWRDLQVAVADFEAAFQLTKGLSGEAG